MSPATQQRVSKDQLLAKAAEFAPWIYFYTDEDFFPAPIDYYVSHCALMVNKNKVISHMSKTQDLISYVYTSKGGNKFPAISDKENDDFRLDPVFDYVSKDELQRGQWRNKRLYLHLKTPPDFPYYDFQYWMFFCYNGEIRTRVSSGTSVLNKGNHDGDWEHITVRTNEQLTPLRIWTSAHSGGDWTNWSKIGKHADRNPKVYCAMYTHALYAEDSSPLRELPLGILSRDWTSKSGRIWDVQSKDLVLIGINKDVEPGQEWIKFRGRWGMDDSSFGSSPNSPYHKETWLGKES